MTAGLKHNILAMKATKQLPSFEQVLVTFEEALDEIDQLIGSKAALQTEINRLRELNDELQEESQHRLEMLQRQKAEIKRLTELLRKAANEIDELGFPSVANTFLLALEPGS
jgi:predicted  nucleic acid-binding Zn-ribbon protein